MLHVCVYQHQPKQSSTAHVLSVCRDSRFDCRYVYKGPDQAAAQLRDVPNGTAAAAAAGAPPQRDEIQDYIDCRSVDTLTCLSMLSSATAAQ